MDTETFDIRFRTKHRFNLHLLCHSITVDYSFDSRAPEGIIN